MLMKKLLLAFGALLASALLVPGDADARRFGGGGGGARISGGGAAFRGGGARMMRPPVRAGVGLRPGGGYRTVGMGNSRGRYDYRYGARAPGYYRGRGRYYAGRYPYYGAAYRRYPYYGGYDGGWGWGAAGLAAGTAISAAAASTYPTYATPVSSTAGGYCATSVRTCTLTSRAPIGIGCSCRTQAGQARGTVVGP
jgi:hypothetical protein